jgi:DNA-binding transcriptional ArsR family regulator
MTEAEELARGFKALSDPNRLKILQLLRECCSECCSPADGDNNSVSRIANRFDLALSTVSHHIKELKIAGLIVCEKRGQTVYCGPNREALEKLEKFLKA